MMLESTDVRKQILKRTAINLNDKFVAGMGNTSLLLGDSMFSTYAYPNTEQAKQSAVEYSHAVFNSTDCDNYLVSYYNLTSTQDIVYVTNKINSTINNDDADSYRFSAYDMNTGHKLDLDLCNNMTYNVQIPIANKSDLNLTMYKELKDQGIDIYNATDPAFTDKCFSHVDNVTGADTTPNWRKDHYYQHNTPMCIGVNCTFTGISSFDYIQCTCTGLKTDSEIVNKLVNMFIKTVSQFNIGVIFCSKTLFTVKL
jgi:hypothetical protein